jgi:acylphosphatase
MAEQSTAIRATVHGRVQAVGFREATVRAAERLGVCGWVENNEDGTVSVHAEATPEALAAFEQFLAEGPTAATVVLVDKAPTKLEGHQQFAIRGWPRYRFQLTQTAQGFVIELDLPSGPNVWALSAPPSMDPAVRRRAVELPAETEITGTALASGLYEPRGRVAWPQAIERGHAMFYLYGDQLKGGFALQRTAPGVWLLIKRNDEFAIRG